MTRRIDEIMEGQRQLGQRFGYPQCCIDHFVSDTLLGLMSAAERGTLPAPSGNGVYVPCAGCLAKSPEGWTPPNARIARIAANTLRIRANSVHLSDAERKDLVHRYERFAREREEAESVGQAAQVVRAEG